MAKGGGSTRTVSANNASASRTQSSAKTTTKYNAEYFDKKTKEINSFRLPKQNDFKDIIIAGRVYVVDHQVTSDKRHIIDIVRASDNYLLGREVYTNSGSYGMATTSTKSQVQEAVRKELLSLFKTIHNEKM